MAGRTLTQHAVPTTFGLKAAQWLAAVDDAADGIAAVLGQLPVQYGGAAGTRALAGRPGARRRPGRRRRRLRGRRSACGPRCRGTPAAGPSPGSATRSRPRPTRSARWRPTCCCSAGPRSASCGRGRRQGGAAPRRCPTSATRCSRCCVRAAALQAPQLGCPAPPRLRDRRRRTPRRRVARRVAGAAAAAGAGGDGGVAGRRAGRRPRGRRRRDGRPGRGRGRRPARGERRRSATVRDYLGEAGAITDAILDAPRRPGGPPWLTSSLTRLAGTGEEPTLLLLGPSLGTDVETLWGRRPHAGSAAASRCVGWDLPGHGRSPRRDRAVRRRGPRRRRPAPGPAELAAVGPTSYAGVSLGGAVGFLLGRRTPAGPPGRHASPARPGSASPRPGRTRRAGPPGRDLGDGRGLGRPLVRPRLPRARPRRPATRCCSRLREADDESYALACEALAGFDVRDRLADTIVPRCVVAGGARRRRHRPTWRPAAAAARRRAAATSWPGCAPPAARRGPGRAWPPSC